MRILFILIVTIFTTIANADNKTIEQVLTRCSDSNSDKLFVKKLTNDAFISKILDSYISWKNIERSYKNSNFYKSNTNNIHDSKRATFIVNIKEGADELSYFHNGDHYFPLCIRLTSEKLNTNSLLVINQDLKYFQSKLLFQGNIDILIIESTEGGNFIKLIFENNKVTSFSYSTTYVD